MTDFIDNLLTSMSSKFNETNSDLVPINLNDDKTLKWRGLHNNQYAAVKKRKDGKRSATSTATTTTATTSSSSAGTDDPPPLINDSNSTCTTTTTTTTITTNTSTKKSNVGAAAVTAETATTTTTTSIDVEITDVTKVDEIDSSSMELNLPNEKSDTTISANNDTNKISDNNGKINNNNDKEKTSEQKGNDDHRPFRRTLRRKQNVDDGNDEMNSISPANRKGGRPKRQSSATGSNSENRSVSPKVEEKNEKTNITATIESANTSDSVTTRRRGRAKKTESDSVVDLPTKNVDETTDTLQKTQIERKNSNVNDGGEDNAVQPTPPKLRRSERTLHSSLSNDHKDLPAQIQATEERSISASETDQTVAAGEQKPTTEKETVTRLRKRTIDEKKSQETATVAVATAGVEATKDEIPATETKSVPSAMKIETAPQMDPKLQINKLEVEPNVKKSSEIEMADGSNVKESSDDVQTAAADAAVIIAIPRKRGRKPGNKLKAKNNLKLNMTIATRNSPAKKSPRFSNDETPFCYTIPKKDKIAAEQAPPQQRLSRRIKPTPKILANEELRQGFEIQNNARLSLSSEHLDNEFDRSPKQKTPPATPPTPEVVRVEAEPPQNGIEKEVVRRQSNTPPKRRSAGSSSNESNACEFVRPARQPCPDPEQFLSEIKQAKINLHRSPEDNKKLNVKQKKRLFKLKEKHFQKLGLQKVAKSSGKDSSSDTNAESDDNEEFVPAKKINVGRPSVTLRVRGQKDIVIYDKHVSKAKPSRDKVKKPTVKVPTTLIDQLDHHSKELISRNPEISLISSTKHKPSTEHTSSPAPNRSIEHHHHQITSEVTLSIRKEPDSNICLCNKISKYYTRKTDETYCSAIDQIENQKVGCGNEVDGELLNLLRPSVRVSYMLLCESHKKRLYSHNCCAGCGTFCTQGRFVICGKNHFFHRDCATKFILNAPFDPQNPDYTCPTLVLKCPHCGVDAPERESVITMRCGSVPIFTTSQKKLTKPAKMSIGPHSYRTLKSREESCLLEIERLVPENVIGILVRAQNRFPFSRGSLYTNKDVFHAITKDDIDRMAEIIASGFDITTPIKEFYNGTCLHLVSNFGSIKMTQLILSRVSSIDFFNLYDKNLRTAVMCALFGDKIDILKLLVQCGADITLKGTDGMTALHLAVKLKNFDAVELLLNTYRECASLYNLEKFLNACDDGGWTAMVWAAELGNAKMVSALLNCGANVNICDSENNTALHWATLSGSLETVMLLLQNGCNLGTQNVNGDTPLHIACRNGNARISVFLLAHGANLDITNNANEAPYDCIPDENGPCGRAIFFNLQIRNIAGLPEQNIICQDISNGREVYPIQLVGRKKYRNARPASNQSDSDNDQLIPDFKYITKTILLQNSIQIDRRVSQMRICSCLDNCTTQNCQCSEISIQNWYNVDGRLNSDFKYHDPAMIFECNDVCGCNRLLCKNRIVQNGSKVALQIFECNERVKGFGVRSITRIPRGTFIAEYTGEILTDNEADRRTDDSYFFDLGASGHCIDANFYGNVSRFFNHSCDPNAVPIRVYYEHQDLRFPKIAFFASKDIDAGDEITFDYGEKFWITKYKQFTCHCGVMSCRFSDRTITKTLEEYNQRNP